MRRTAAWLLVAVGGLDQGRDRLGAAADPVARVALVVAMAVAARSRRDDATWSRAVVRLRPDPVTAVRLLANL
jgi:hypothetical protein